MIKRAYPQPISSNWKCDKNITLAIFGGRLYTENRIIKSD